MKWFIVHTEKINGCRRACLGKSWLHTTEKLWWLQECQGLYPGKMPMPVFFFFFVIYLKILKKPSPLVPLLSHSEATFRTSPGVQCWQCEHTWSVSTWSRSVFIISESSHFHWREQKPTELEQINHNHLSDLNQLTLLIATHLLRGQQLTAQWQYFLKTLRTC